MLASVRHRESSIQGWIEIVRAACAEASVPVDNEVRQYILAEVHSKCEAAKPQVAGFLAVRIKQAEMSSATGLEKSLLEEAVRRISMIESEIRRELKLEELKEHLKVKDQSKRRPEISQTLPGGDFQQGVDGAAGHKKWTLDQRIAAAGVIAVVVIGLVTLVVMVVVPEIRARLKLDEPTNAVQSPAKSPAPGLHIERSPTTAESDENRRLTGAHRKIGLGENNTTSDAVSAVAWSAAVERSTPVRGAIETSILVWPRAPITLPARLRIFYTYEILTTPSPRFASSTGHALQISDWSTAENALTFTVARGSIEQNDPMRVIVYSATQLGVADVVCLSCK
ncbi:MAG: hypothetical protein ACRD4X_08410 [Candidatus Acidiferrales bacterium]